MINGLKVTIGARELEELCRARATHHREREAFYNEKAASLKGIDSQDSHTSFSNSSSGDPIKQMEASASNHKMQAEELEFIAGHLDADEQYQLDQADLIRIGIVTRGW